MGTAATSRPCGDRMCRGRAFVPGDRVGCGRRRRAIAAVLAGSRRPRAGPSSTSGTACHRLPHHRDRRRLRAPRAGLGAARHARPPDRCRPGRAPRRMGAGPAATGADADHLPARAVERALLRAASSGSASWSSSPWAAGDLGRRDRPWPDAAAARDAARPG
ncbi:hypothetical protein HBB16_05110 [Pseudonocardia sp. MCCB 268]|nr:hypothetical protein [Pseudonocardia cytotoxica]